MKLLLSCYECSPVRGSECGVGWHWTYEARRLGHEVWALVSPTYEGEIREACRTDALAAGINWIFPQSPYWRVASGHRPKAERRHNLLWQIAALTEARKLARDIRFDAVHQVTWGGLRVPSFLWKLHVPFILGPVGGGETSPPGLRDAFSTRNRVTEWVRDLSNATLMLNPPMRLMLNAATIIAAKTPATRDLFPERLRRETLVDVGIGITEERIGPTRRQETEPVRILFIGRLLYWKGVHLALSAFEHISRERPDACFTIIGSGPEEKAVLERIGREDLSERVTFVPWMPQARVFELYDEHDLFLFPSLHDSSGMVVLEALGRGLPVVCLDLGGPAEMVDETCGVVVDTASLNSSQVAKSLARATLKIIEDRARWKDLSDGAIARAIQFLWRDRVASFYRTIEPRIVHTSDEHSTIARSARIHA